MIGKCCRPTRFRNRLFLGKVVAIGIIACLNAVMPTAISAPVPKGGTIEAAIQLLTMWGEKSPATIQLYTAIYQALATSPKATFETVTEDETAQKLIREQEIMLLGGPMLGQIKENGATVWVRTTAPAGVEVKAVIDGKERIFGPVKSTFESDLSAVVPMTGLPAGALVPYQVWVDGKKVETPGDTAVRTLPNSRQSMTRIVFGTCQHRWGLGNGKMTETILARKPHAMLVYGDVAVQDRRNNLGMHRADYALRDFHPAWRELVCAIPVYASWDDHDYFSNDAWGIPRNCTDADRRGVRKVFTQAWNNPYYGLGNEGGGIFTHTRIGACDVIMTDNRYFRTKEGKHNFLGPEQMSWLKKTLLACKGPFIVMSCGTMWSDYVSNGKDSWGKYDPEGREEIFKLIEDNKIGGVLLISGDRHGARGFRIPRPSGYTFYEFEPAGLGGRRGPPATHETWTTQLFGISGKYAFGEFTFDADKPDPDVTFRLIGQDADIIYELTLKRSDLTFALSDTLHNNVLP